MERSRGIVSGSLAIDRDTELSGIVEGDVSVAAGCTVAVSGIMTGDILLAPGAHATVSGMLKGTIVRR